MRGKLLLASTAVLLAGCTAYKPVGEGSQVPWADSLASKRAALAVPPVDTDQPQPLIQPASLEQAMPAAQAPGDPAPVSVTALPSDTEPAPKATVTPAVARQPERSAAPPAPGTHTVSKGEWLLEIARGYEVDPKVLAATNDLVPPYPLRPGQVLTIPAAGGAVTAAKPSAPSSAVPAASSASANQTYVVVRGDGLYGIARQHGVSHEELALANELDADAYLVPGQELVIPTAGSAGAAPVVVAEATPSAVVEPAAEAGSASAGTAFVWPVDGKVISRFGEEDDGETRSGIAIEARKGTPVKAARDGVVVYAGDAIRGYGRMILLRHDDGFVTAYGHNSAILVNVGDNVEQNQVIARVGDTGGVPTPQLHFEVRQGKQPIDPSTVLSASSTTVAQSTG